MDSPIVPLTNPPTYAPSLETLPALFYTKTQLARVCRQLCSWTSLSEAIPSPRASVLLPVTLTGPADSYLLGLYGRSGLVQACWGGQLPMGQRGWWSRAGLGTLGGCGQLCCWRRVFGWPGASHLHGEGKEYRNNKEPTWVTPFPNQAVGLGVWGKVRGTSRGRNFRPKLRKELWSYN